MNRKRQIEIWVGVFMAIGFAALFLLAMKISNLGTAYSGELFHVTARFDNIGGLKVKAPVTIAGVEVGRVQEIRYDPDDFRAVVVLGIQGQYLGKIPDDSFAKILTAGLLGEQYIGIDPGGSEDTLKEGSEISITQSVLVLEEVIGQFIFGKSQEGAGTE
ncbi:outer membrane lipid asymmetry maintenance protein MlaD [endosymbiont of unidentified scaly snail isolate Monju]|uniref:outer membrane lipid asymmetry maintenance protein MlaD n=1 Tax=endosymbiont of unidentified scaly snail isolate Monju TaxID=1248727 RepID=UPI0003891CC0|nr:outer membrane lipid asymmetry maintenance protein MlaD [endosymbiont of unidentified scaly snail isolate Monju]BAN70067.1 ABC transporter substrate-binding protein [endosymbiont of unidentified scaly snail isolate Monju]